MINSAPFPERVRRAFRPTPHGVVGLVEDLLGLCQAHQLRIDFQGSHCRIRSLGSHPEDSLDLPLAKSVFRGVLARIAALCNEHHPGSVTPYRGEGEIVVPVPVSPNCSPPSTCHVEFTNTPSDQRLEVRFSRNSVADGTRFTVLLRDRRTVTVFGNALQYVRHNPNSQEDGSYGILSRVGGAEVFVALFPVREVTGVFSGAVEESDNGAKSA